MEWGNDKMEQKLQLNTIECGDCARTMGTKPFSNALRYCVLLSVNKSPFQRDKLNYSQNIRIQTDRTLSSMQKHAHSAHTTAWAIYRLTAIDVACSMCVSVCPSVCLSEKTMKKICGQWVWALDVNKRRYGSGEVAAGVDERGKL